MSNTKEAVAGDIVRYVGPESFDLTIGKLYVIDSVSSYTHMDGTRGKKFKDDKGNERAFWVTSYYEIVGKVVEEPTLTDIHGQTVKVGDYVAYAFRAAAGRTEQRVFQVQHIDRTVAYCHSVTDSIKTYLGAFDQYALKLKDYAA